MQVHKLALNPTHDVNKSASNTPETANVCVSVTAHTYTQTRLRETTTRHLVNPSAHDDDVTSSDTQHLLGCVVRLPLVRYSLPLNQFLHVQRTHADSTDAGVCAQVLIFF